MKQLIILAHGSRRQESNEFFLTLVKQLTPLLCHDYTHVSACFLELTTPDLPSTIDTCIANGATAVDVFPYFLAPGNHVQHDIPQLLKHASEKYPHCHFKQLDYFGANPDLPQLISQCILEQR